MRETRSVHSLMFLRYATLPGGPETKLHYVKQLWTRRGTSLYHGRSVFKPLLKLSGKTVRILDSFGNEAIDRNMLYTVTECEDGLGLYNVDGIAPFNLEMMTYMVVRE